MSSRNLETIINATEKSVYLFSMDSEGFWAAPSTTGGLKAYYLEYGDRREKTTIELIHFRDEEAVQQWQQTSLEDFVAEANQSKQQVILGFSVYTWNAAEFLALIHRLKHRCSNLLVIAGGPHVQQAEDYLYDDPIDAICLGEGEETFKRLIDASDKKEWPAIDGLAYLDEQGTLVKTKKRERRKNLDELPSALNVLPLQDDNGKALYDSYSYETSRGCPFKCAFCEWGTGAIGSKMFEFSLPRIHKDWKKIFDAGIKDLWLADSNFGALKQDRAKAEMICNFKIETGLPTSFATSWSKKHSPQVQDIVLLLHKHDLLPHYQLALQTLTPLALELSHRKNMGANKYKPIAKQMSEQGVPIAAELIWGLPGDNLQDFEKNLDTLLAQFPKINIFGYTLLPGTEFYEKREEYNIETIPVAGYGKAKGEYVIGCHTYPRQEGLAGYFLISAHILLNHGYIMPLTIRFMALKEIAPVSTLLRGILESLILEVDESLSGDAMAVYEARSALYLQLLAQKELTYSIIETCIRDQLHDKPQELSDALQILQLDKARCPSHGEKKQWVFKATFNARQVEKKLEAMDIPSKQDLASSLIPKNITIHTPGGVGSIINDPDGGSWARGLLAEDDLPGASATRENQADETTTVHQASESFAASS